MYQVLSATATGFCFIIVYVSILFCSLFVLRHRVLKNGLNIFLELQRTVDKKGVRSHGFAWILYKKVGYEYVIIDDCWFENERDSMTNELVGDRKRFPNGIRALADYVSTMTQFCRVSARSPSINTVITSDLLASHIYLHTDPWKRIENWHLSGLWNENVCWLS